MAERSVASLYEKHRIDWPGGASFSTFIKYRDKKIFCSLILDKPVKWSTTLQTPCLFFLLFVHISFAQDNRLPRSSGHLFYFKPTQALILIDGYEKGTRPPRAETWAWKNGWTRLEVSDQPLRSLSAAAYIQDKDQIFVFGGIGIRGRTK